MQLCERLLLEFPEKIHGKAGPIYRALLLCIIFASSESRTTCLAILRNIVNSLSGNMLSQSILKDLNEYLETVKIQV